VVKNYNWKSRLRNFLIIFTGKRNCTVPQALQTPHFTYRSLLPGFASSHLKRVRKKKRQEKTTLKVYAFLFFTHEWLSKEEPVAPSHTMMCTPPLRMTRGFTAFINFLECFPWLCCTITSPVITKKQYPKVS